MASRNGFETPTHALGGQLLAGYRLSENFLIETGVGFAQFGWQHRIDFSELTFGDPIDPRRGFIYSTGANDALPERAVFIDKLHYVSIPLGACMELGRGRWRSTTVIGASASFLIDATHRSVVNHADGSRRAERSAQPFDFASFNLIPYLGTGVAFQSSDRWQWQLRPTLQYGAARIIDAPVSAQVYSLSLAAGVRIGL